MDGELMLDVSRLVQRRSKGRLPTGVDRVGLAYVRHFGPSAQAVLQWHGWRRIVSYRESQRLFELLLDPPAAFVRQTALAIARFCTPPWSSQHGRRRFYVNVNHAGIESPELSAWLRQTNQRAVYFVHDLIPVTHPEYCRRGDAERHADRLRAMLRSADALITNSAATLGLLAEFAHREKLAIPPSISAPIAPAALDFRAGEAPPMDVPYFVVVGTIEPRKNHSLLLHVWRELVERLGDGAPHLVVIGQRGWECENVVDLLERAELLRGRVHEIADCSDSQLAQYVGHARALLFPSFAEGYGMPLVEALSMGTPAIATDLPAFREAAGDVPDYLHPLDGPAWMEAVLDYARPDSARRAAHLQRLQGWRAPTWDEHFRLVESLLEELK